MRIRLLDSMSLAYFLLTPATAKPVEPQLRDLLSDACSPDVAVTIQNNNTRSLTVMMLAIVLRSPAVLLLIMLTMPIVLMMNLVEGPKFGRRVMQEAGAKVDQSPEADVRMAFRPTSA